MFRNKTVRWHRPDQSLELDGELAELEIEGTPTRVVFSLFVKVAGKSWALGVPLAQLRKPEVDLYVFHYTSDGDEKALTPAGEEGFEALQRELEDPNA